MKGEKVGGERLVDNSTNSFMYREAKRIKTNKSSLYLGLRADSAGISHHQNLHVVRYAVVCKTATSNAWHRGVLSSLTLLADMDDAQ